MKNISSIALFRLSVLGPLASRDKLERKGALNIKTRIIKALLKKVEYPDISKPKIKGENRPNVTGQMIDFIISSLIQQAIKGNTRAFEILLDRTGIHLESDNDEKHEPNKFEIHIIDPNGYLKNETDEKDISVN